jgi:uracil-DNA glycosylase
MQRHHLDRFISELAAARMGSTVNPYAAEHEQPDVDRRGAAAIRRANLRDYLVSRAREPVLLVGEAAGYRGCRFSGIAFTSERSLAAERWSSRMAAGWQEPSATVVHRVLEELSLEEDVMLWNALPFHPAGPTPLSNRAPTRAELVAGVIWLHRLMGLVRPRAVLAVGRTAARVLPGAPTLRHPSHGGATTFARQLREWARWAPTAGCASTIDR